MMTLSDIQVLMAVLQILLAATAAIAIAGLLSWLPIARPPVFRERLWMSVLIGVVLSPAVPLLSSFAPFQIAAFSLLPINHADLPQLSSNDAPAEAFGRDENLSVEPISAEQPPLKTELPATISESSHLGSIPVAAPSAVIQSRPRNWQSLVRPALWGITLSWLVGVVFLSIRTGKGLRICHRIKVRAVPFDAQYHSPELQQVQQILGGRVHLRIVVSPDVAGPAVIGIWQPTIVLPASDTDWLSGPQLVQVLLHEGAHIQRHDTLVNLVQNVLCILWWPHPLIHFMNCRLTQAREEVCDNWVLAHCHAADYAETLLQMTERSRGRRIVATAVTMLSPRCWLERRVAGILDPQRDLTRQWPHSQRWALQAVLLLVPALIGLVRLNPRVAQSAEPQLVTQSAEPASPAVTQGTKKLTGQVVRGISEDPVAGAEVTLILPLSDADQDSVRPMAVRHTDTDARGAFHFEGLAAGQYRIWSQHQGQTSRRRSVRGTKVTVAESGETDPVKLTLTPAASVTVRVTNHQTGQSIPEAVIHIGRDSLQQGNFVTDKNGEVTIESIGAGRWEIGAVAADRARQWKTIDVDEGTAANLEFDLEPGGEIEGTVRDPQGKAVAGVAIGIGQQGDIRMHTFGRTDSAGHFRVMGAPLDVPIFAILSRADFLSEGGVQMRLTSARTVHDFTIKPRPTGVTIAGKVTNESGQPVAGALIQNRGVNYDSTEDEPMANELREMTTGADGVFRLENLYRWGASNPTLEVSAPKFVPQRVEVALDTPDQLTKLEIKLAPGHRLAGRVMSEKGEGLPRITVTAAPATDGVFRAVGQTDAAGQFEADTLPANARLRFTREGFESLEKSNTPLDRSDEQFFVMFPSGSIVGRVLDTKTGQPIRAFRIMVSADRTDPQGVRPRRRFDVDGGRAIRSKEGRFALENLTAGGPYLVTIDSDGYARRASVPLQAVRRTAPQPVDIKLDPIDPTSVANYSVRLLDAEKKPMKGAQLRLIVARDRQSRPGHTAFPYPWWTIQLGQLPLLEADNVVRFDKGTTDAEGRYVFKSVPLKLETELVWWGEDVIPGRIDHFDQRLSQNRGEAIEVVLPKAAKITGRIDRTEFPEAVSIQIHREDGADAQRKLTLLQSNQTTFEIGGLGAGKYVIAIQANHGAARGADGPIRPITSKNITLKEGETTEVNFDER